MSQMDKWNRKMSKVAEGHELKQMEMKRNAGKSELDMAVEASQKAGFRKVSTEDVAMVLFRDSIEPFVNIWTNSVDSKMHNVMEEMVMPMMKNEIRDMVKDVVREVVQDEIQQALRGAMAGLSQAIAPMFQVRNPHIVPGLDTDGDLEVAIEEPVFMNGLQQLAEQKKMEAVTPKKPRYAVARITTCSICGEQGHNKRSCKKEAVTNG